MEFTLVMPLLLLLVVGIIDFGLMFSDVIGVRGGAGDGARQAAVGRFGTATNGQEGCELVPEYNVTGSAELLMCLTKSRDNVADSRARLRVMVGEVGCENTPGGCYKVGAPITLCAQYRMKSIAPKFSFGTALDGRVFTNRTVVRIETLSGSGLQTAWEKPFEPWSCSAPAP